MIYQIQSDIGYTNQKAFIELSELKKSTNRIPIESKNVTVRVDRFCELEISLNSQDSQKTTHAHNHIIPHRLKHIHMK